MTIGFRSGMRLAAMNKVPVRVFPTHEHAVQALADEVTTLIEANRAAGKPTVLGLATGGTPIPFYQELIRRHKEEGFSFRDVITFNLDEYLGLERDHAESYWTFMHIQLFNHIDIPAGNIHLPSGTVAGAEVEAHCAEYEKMIRDAGGLDFQLLGIGRTGHIGFNEPGSAKDSLTREVHLDEITRQDAAPAFGGLNNVPTAAITMGCGTILAARRIVLLAWGQKKAEIVKEAVQGTINDVVSASYLQEHPNAEFFLDPEAASAL